MLFFDRPGHGWSGRGPGNNEDPSAQAATIAALMDRLGIKKAIIVGHSFGSVVTAAFGREHADKTLGLVFLAPATHPWPGGATSWYYDLTTVPVIGRLFSETLTYPAGTLQMADATTCVFSPNKVPDNYLNTASIPLVLRPAAFRVNAADVAGLYRYALGAAPHYNQITAPTTEYEHVPGERILRQRRLRQCSQAIHAFAHVRHPCGKPYPGARRQRDHRCDISSSTVRSESASTGPLSRMRPPASSTSITPTLRVPHSPLRGSSSMVTGNIFAASTAPASSRR